MRSYACTHRAGFGMQCCDIARNRETASWAGETYTLHALALKQTPCWTNLGRAWECGLTYTRNGACRRGTTKETNHEAELELTTFRYTKARVQHLIAPKERNPTQAYTIDARG